MTWHGQPEGASLTDWCRVYRFRGLDVTVRGGEFVGLWVGDGTVAVDVDDEVGERILASVPTPALARVGRSSMMLLAERDISVLEVDLEDARILGRHVFRLPTGHPSDPYLWRVTPDVPIRLLSELMKTLGWTAQRPE